MPVGNFNLLKTLVEHLKNVASHSQKNLMTVSNLGICFAPTLMRGPDESSLSIMEIKYSNVVANTLIEEYDSIFNGPRMNRPKRQQNNQQQQNQQQYNFQQPLYENNVDDDLAQFAIKSSNYHTSRPLNTFISSNPIPNVDIRPINDIKTYSYDQPMIVPMEQSCNHQFHNNPQQQSHSHLVHQQPSHFRHLQQHHLGGSMNNSLNFIGYANSQTSSHPNSLNYSTNSLNTGFLNDQYNNIDQMPFYSLDSNKLLYRSGTAITLYPCKGDTESELSFEPNEIITDGK